MILCLTLQKHSSLAPEEDFKVFPWARPQSPSATWNIVCLVVIATRLKMSMFYVVVVNSHKHIWYAACTLADAQIYMAWLLTSVPAKESEGEQWGILVLVKCGAFRLIGCSLGRNMICYWFWAFFVWCSLPPRASAGPLWFGLRKTYIPSCLVTAIHLAATR